MLISSTQDAKQSGHWKKLDRARQPKSRRCSLSLTLDQDLCALASTDTMIKVSFKSTWILLSAPSVALLELCRLERVKRSMLLSELAREIALQSREWLLPAFR